MSYNDMVKRLATVEAQVSTLQAVVGTLNESLAPTFATWDAVEALILAETAGVG